VTAIHAAVKGTGKLTLVGRGSSAGGEGVVKDEMSQERQGVMARMGSGRKWWGVIHVQTWITLPHPNRYSDIRVYGEEEKAGRQQW